MKMYNILGVMKGLNDNAKTEQINESVKQETVYENVEPRGSIMDAVKSLAGKFAKFNESAKPDFLDIDKDGDKKEPMKKAAKDKNNAKGAFKDMFGGDSKELTSKLKIKEGAGPYTLDDPKHPKFKANYEKYKKAHPDCTLAEFVAAMRKKEKGLSEGIDDLTDLDAYQFADPDKDTAVAPASAKQSAAEKRRRLQDIEDRKAEKDDWFSGNDKEPNVRIHRAKYQDEPEVDEGTIAKPKKDLRKHSATAKRMAMQKKADKGHEEWLDNLEKTDPDHPSLKYRKQSALDEVAPPGAKAERMVKHIKKGYSKDGNLTKKEKGIAYATAWKAKKAGVVEGTEFKDTIANSKAELKKAKPAMVKESRVMEETDYFYEKVGKALAEKNSYLDTASGEFADAVRKEMVAQGIPPNKARNILLMDEDFLSDVATSYGHYCKVDTHHPLPDEIDLNEIARLAGLPVRETEVYNEVNHEQVDDSMDEDAMGAVMGGIAGGMIGKTPGAVATGAKLGSAARDTFNSAVGLDEVDDLDEVTAPPMATPGKAPAAKATGMAPAKGNVPPTPTFNEEEVEEGNEFSGALAKAKASGAKEFEVDGKKYTVKEDVNINVTANGDEDAMNLIRKLAGMPAITVVQNPESNVRDVEAVEVDEERDIEYTNTPNEKIAPLGAAFPSGSGEDRAKKMYRKEYPGDNPMAVREDVEGLWEKYSNMLKGLTK